MTGFRLSRFNMRPGSRSEEPESYQAIERTRKLQPAAFLLAYDLLAFSTSPSSLVINTTVPIISF